MLDVKSVKKNYNQRHLVKPTQNGIISRVRYKLVWIKLEFIKKKKINLYKTMLVHFHRFHLEAQHIFLESL